MSQVTGKDSKEQIMSAFSQLLGEYKKTESKVATKEEEADKQKNEQLLVTVANYTVDNMVNSMAGLQLDFGNIINELNERLTRESSKLEELKQAITVEKENLAKLCQIRLVADAFYILRQEHQEKLRILQNRHNNEQEAIENDMTKTRKTWTKEQQEFETRTTESAEFLQKQREQEEGDFEYETERIRQVEMDEYESAKRNQERELQSQNQEKEKGWVEREKFLADHQEELAGYLKQIEGFEEALNKSYNDAKGEAIKEAEREAKVKADLFEKEWEATQQGYELKIQSLENTIQKQTEQIAELTTQLQTVTTQAQNLALRAFQD